jgi:hypothetical protein
MHRMCAVLWQDEKIQERKFQRALPILNRIASDLSDGQATTSIKM